MSYRLNEFYLLRSGDRLTGGDEWCRGHVHQSSYVRGDVWVDDVLCGVMEWDVVRWDEMEWDVI